MVIRLFLPVLFSLLLPLWAQAGLGISRAQAEELVEAIGLETWKTDFPPYEGEPHTSISATLDDYGMGNLTLDMFGPDRELTGLELNLLSADEPETFVLQGSLIVSLLTITCPDWEGGPDWVVNALSKGKASRPGGRDVTIRNGNKVEIARTQTRVVFAITASG